MKRVSLAGLAAGMLATAAPWVTNPAVGPVTFYKDVLPIFQEKCQGCHRPGQPVPISLLTYREARPWATAIRASVITGKMPPWNLEVRNLHRLLTSREIETIVTWVDTGAARGDPRDARPISEWAVAP